MLGGTSWMDYLARNDMDVWMIDQRGYIYRLSVAVIHHYVI